MRFTIGKSQGEIPKGGLTHWGFTYRESCEPMHCGIEKSETLMRRFGCAHIGGGHVDHELNRRVHKSQEAGGPSISGDYVDH
jgi:hypothetical protein